MSWNDFATQKPVPNHGGVMSAHLGLVLHVQEGNNSLAGWFSNPASGASSTWWVSKTGVIEQYVDTAAQAWAQAAGNATFNSVETEGFTTEPLCGPQSDGLVSIYRWGHLSYGWPLVLSESPTAGGFGWHGMGGAAWGNHPGCPGSIRRAQRQSVLDLVNSTPPPGGIPDMLVAISATGQGYWIVKPDGSVYAFGDAIYKGGVNNAGPGGTNALPAGDTITGFAGYGSGPAASGYVVTTARGNVYAFGYVPYLGKP